MEKLQAALDKARASRAGVAPRTSPAASPNLDGLNALWEDLTPFEVDDSHLETRRVVTRSANPQASPFDILRTKVLLQMRQHGWTRLAITSPTGQSGKTTTACNLAMGLGRQKELRTILLDLDLRDPSVGSFFKTKQNDGIADVLQRKVSFADQALRIGNNVAFSTANYSEHDPTRLLLAEESQDVINEIESTYQPDILIFDLPSVLVNDDTRAFLKNTDCALIVIRAKQTKFNQFDTCEREVAEQTNVLGSVLNAFPYGKS